MTSSLEARLQYLVSDAEAVAADVEAEVIRLKSACSLALKRLRQHRETMDKLTSAPVVQAEAKAVLAALEADYGFNTDQLRSVVKTAALAEARQVGLWLLSRAKWTAADAAAVFNRERTNTNHAMNAVQARLATEPKFKARVDKLCAELGLA